MTHSVVMRARSRTVRFIKTFHDFETKTIRLRSSGREHPLLEKSEPSDEAKQGLAGDGFSAASAASRPDGS